MTDEHRPSEAERHLDDHLDLLRQDPPRPSRKLTTGIVRSARWQREVRAPLRVALTIAGAIVDGLIKLAGTNKQPSQ